MKLKTLAFALALLPLAAAANDDIARHIAELDEKYQQAVKRNDAQTMAGIVHEDFTLVNGKGVVVKKDALLASARDELVRYQQQDVIDNSRTVRVAGDTAVITAKLWLKGDLKRGGHVDKVLWFSDTYVKTAQGWKYFFGQASLALPDDPKAQLAADTAAIRAMNDEYIRAWRRHDMKWFEDNLAEGYSCVAPDGTVLDKKAFIGYPDQSVLVADSHVEDLTVQVHGQTAVVTGKNVVFWKDGRKSATRYTDTYAKIDGKWKAVSAQLTKA
jgi:ketosteroid isomerase-like protein